MGVEVVIDVVVWSRCLLWCSGGYGRQTDREQGVENTKVKDNIGVMMDVKCLSFKRGAKL